MLYIFWLYGVLSWLLATLDAVVKQIVVLATNNICSISPNILIFFSPLPLQKTVSWVDMMRYAARLSYLYVG